MDPNKVDPTGGTLGYAAANGLTIAYETFGSPRDAPVLLIMGLGTQMLGWPDELCQALASSGHYVVRFDNRDVGLSTHLGPVPTPSVVDVTLRRATPPYTIEDMAMDAAGLLDALHIHSAHVVGASMGGFIAQTLAISHPEKVSSLTLIMTTTGSLRVGKPKMALMARLLRPKGPMERQGAMDAIVSTFRVIGSRGYALDEDYLRDLSGRSYDRSHDPAGYQRQLAACVVQPNRTRQLRALYVPTVVIHGLADPLVSPSGGLALARAIPGANFVGLGGMGHDLPRPLWPRFVGEILDVAARASGRLASLSD